jgi:hypothetical protein
LKYITNFCNIIEQVKDMSKTDKIKTFMEGLHSAIQAKVDYHMSERLEEAMKIVVNYDNTHFHKPSTSKAITKTSQKKEHIIYISPHLKTSSYETTELINLDSINQSKEYFKKKLNKLSLDTCYQYEKIEYITKNCKDKTFSTKEKSVVVSSTKDNIE